MSERRIVVTGGASGLGAAVARLLAERGDEVAVLDIQPAPAASDGHYHSVDLADARAAEQAVAAAADAMGGLDAVVTCAGIDACGPFGAVSAGDWERVIAVNLVGTAAVVRAALPWLRRPEAHVVTVASTLGLRALPDASAYCASKFGVIGFSRALGAELGGRPAVTCLIPGGMATAFFDGRDEQYRPAADAHLNDPVNVARAVAFALDQPAGCEVRELVVCPANEPSWP